MSQLLLSPPRLPSRTRTNFAEQQPDSPVSGGRRLTLDERISRVWEGILATGAVDCPVCRGRMERMGDSARCLTCNSVLT
jgi:hypothetical protein